MARSTSFSRQADQSILIRWSGNSGNRDQWLSTGASSTGTRRNMGSAAAWTYRVPPDLGALWKTAAFTLWIREYFKGTNNPSNPNKPQGSSFAVPAAGKLPGLQSVSAVRSGANIVVSWVPVSVSVNYGGSTNGTIATRMADTVTEFQVYEGNTLKGTVGRNSRSFTVASPAAGAHTYKVRARGMWPGGTLVSDFRNANTVQAVTPPNAPTNLAPNGMIYSATLAIQLEWRHNPVDGSPQKALQLRYRYSGESTWNTLAKTSSTESKYAIKFPAASVPIEWQVMTWGEHATGSPWSAVATVQPIDLPTVESISVDNSAFTTVKASFVLRQRQGVGPVIWAAELIDAAGKVLETVPGFGAVNTRSTAAFTVLLSNAETYTIRVRASVSEIYGPFAMAQFTTNFPVPLPPHGFGEWNDETGTAVIECQPVLTDSLWEPIDDFELLEQDTLGQIEISRNGNRVRIEKLAEALNEGESQCRFELPRFDGSLVRIKLVSAECLDAGESSYGLLATLDTRDSEGNGNSVTVWENSALPIVVLLTEDTKFFTVMIPWTRHVILDLEFETVPFEVLTAATDRIDHLALRRSVDGGETWETVQDPISSEGGEINDRESLSHGVTLYRLEAWSDLPSMAFTEFSVEAESYCVWLHALEDAALPCCRLVYNPALGVTPVRERGHWQFGGNRVAWASENQGLQIDYSGVLQVEDDATRQEMITMGLSESPVHVHRDPEGRRVYGVLQAGQVTRELSLVNHGSTSYTLTETGRPSEKEVGL